MQAVITQNTPEFEMLPAVAPNYYPFEMGSFKPYTHFRMGIQQDQGVFVNITAYQQADWILKQYPNPPENIFMGNCVSLSLGCEGDERYINITCDIYGRTSAWLCQDQEVLLDITHQVVSDFEPLFSRGYSEVGYYWVSTFLLSKELLESFYQSAPYQNLRANGFVLCENPDFTHFGSVHPLWDLKNRSVYRGEGLLPLHVTKL